MKKHVLSHYNDPCSSKKKIVITTWAITNVSIFPFFISVCVATGVVSSDGHGGVAFSLLWTFFHTIALLIFGTYTLFKNLTLSTYGMLTASCLLMGSWMLQTCIVIGQYNCVAPGNLTSSSGFADCLKNNPNPGAIRSTIAFGVFLFLGYIVTGFLLIFYRKEIASQGQLETRTFLENSIADPSEYDSQPLPSTPKYEIEDDDSEEEIILEGIKEDNTRHQVQAATL